MFGKVFNNLEWKKIASSEFNSFKQFRQDLRSKLIKANKNKGKKFLTILNIPPVIKYLNLVQEKTKIK